MTTRKLVQKEAKTWLRRAEFWGFVCDHSESLPKIREKAEMMYKQCMEMAIEYTLAMVKEVESLMKEAPLGEES